MHLTTNHHFHAVGQGLFASGDVSLDDGCPFRWVYDCGTASGKKYLNREISLLADRWKDESRPHLDLVAISHFDQDHVNGLVELLKTFSVATLLLPYIPLWQRLLVGFDSRLRPSQRIFGFFVDPIRYLLSHPNIEIQQVIFVQGGSGETPPPTESFRINSERGVWFEVDEEINVEENYQGLGVHFLKKGSRLLASAEWEFVPYNDISTVATLPSSFVKAVAARRDELLGASSAKGRKKALYDLRSVYDKQFGETSKARNIISLFLYSGPTNTRYKYRDFDMVFSHATSWDKCLYEWGQYRLWPEKKDCCATLYTGDGCLNTKARLTALTNHLGEERLTRIGCMQVMHHGAKSSWHQGVAQTLRPSVSVFSCDPGNKKYEHPHGPVVRDFLPFQPIQVDKETRFSIRHSVYLPLL